MNLNSPIARAIAELETERQNLIARLAKVDQAIVGLRALFHLPAPPVTRPPRAVDSASDDEIPARILTALANGSLSPAELALAVGLDRHSVHQHVLTLERAAKLVCTGATINRRIALAATPAAKEALRR